LNNSPPGYGVLLKMKGVGVACFETAGPEAAGRGATGGAACTRGVFKSTMASTVAHAVRGSLRMFMFSLFRVVKRRRIGCMSWKGCSRIILSTRGAARNDSARTFAFTL
jgi:hypothetical protein